MERGAYHMIADDVYGQKRSRKMQNLAMKRELDKTRRDGREEGINNKEERANISPR